MSSPPPRVFLKKDHGFSAQTFPLLAFAPMGGREKFLRESDRNSTVFIAGTLTAPTPEHQRGRLLARVTVGHRPVSTVAVLESLGVQIQPHEYNAQGEYRWPDGLPLLTVELVQGSPLLKDLFGHNLSGNHWATFAMDVRHAIDDDAAQMLLELPTVPEPLPTVPLLTRESTLLRTVSSDRQYGASGPPPADWQGTAGHTLTWGSAYLLRLDSTRRPLSHGIPIWKVGKAIKPVERWKTLNRHLLPSVTGYRWSLVRTADFETEEHAFAFEQAVHRVLARSRLAPEREIFQATEKTISQAWSETLFSGDWALRV